MERTGCLHCKGPQKKNVNKVPSCWLPRVGCICRTTPIDQQHADKLSEIIYVRSIYYDNYQCEQYVYEIYLYEKYQYDDYLY
jgi:hypothetical protein